MIVDWAPWHHTAGGNHNFGFVLYNGGTLYIDEGKPVPGAIETTVRNLREVAANWYFTVPKGYEALLPYLPRRRQLREVFFSRLKVIWFAGAALSQSVFDEMQELALATCGERIVFLTGLGSTETAPMALARMWQSTDSTNMGVPAPGVELKLVPTGGKLEARLRGPNIMPGYWRQPELTAQPSTMTASTVSETRSSSQILPIRAPAFCSMAASPRTSSWRPAPGSMSGRCGRNCLRSSSRSPATSSSPVAIATRSAP